MSFRLSLSLFPGFLAELVVHSMEWATGSQLLTQFAPFSGLLNELVVHSTEWATGSQLLTQFEPFPGLLFELVVHWLTTFDSVCPFFQAFSTS